MARPVRVLIVDDDPISRRMLSHVLSLDPHLEVIGTASDAYDARDQIVRKRPDVLTLDIDMPRMDGAAFLEKLMPRLPLPVVMVTGTNSERLGAALKAGAVDVVFKPGLRRGRTLQHMHAELCTKLKIAASIDVSHFKSALAPEQQRGDLRTLIAIGASTGGTDAIEEVLRALQPTCPPVLIVQHMPQEFTGPFARRLNECASMLVREARDGDILQCGTALVAPGNQHMSAGPHGSQYRIRLSGGDPVSGHRPSVDFMMSSVARVAGTHAIGVLLTGMGRDGAQGLLKMRRAGAKTIAQDEQSSIVYGMPRVAWELGAVQQRLPLGQIGPTLSALVTPDAQRPLRGTG